MLYLYGASGHAKVIIDIITANGLTLNGLYDDNILIKELKGYPVFKTTGITQKTKLLISIGNNEIRRKIAMKTKADYYTLFHTSTILSPSSRIGLGSVVMQSAVVQSDVVVGNHVILNTAASIDHECIIEDYVHISPNSTLCGNVKVGEGSWIGAGTIILPGVKVGKWSVIGAGSVVYEDIPDYCLALGNRCKVVKRY